MRTYLFLILLSITAQSQTFYDRDWATYYFGGIAYAQDIIVDSQGNIIVSGHINNLEETVFYEQFATPNAFQSTLNEGQGDGFLCKFSPNGNLIWATYFGAEGYDSINQFELDENDNIYGIGYTHSIANFTTPNAFITEVPSLPAGFIVKFSPSGQRLWCTYFPDTTADIKVKDNKIYIVGLTKAITNISTEGTYGQIAIQNSDVSAYTGVNGYINVFDLNGNRLYGTYFGKVAQGMVFLGYNIAVDNNDDIIIIGHTRNDSNLNFASPNCFQSSYAGGTYDTFISKFSSDLTQRYWSTFYGGNALETVADMEVDFDNNIYITGNTRSTDLITTTESHQNQLNGNSDGFIAKFNTDGGLLWDTLFGGNNSDILYKVILKDETLYIVGNSTSDALATPNVFQQNLGSTTASDGIFGAFSSNGSLLWCSYYGGEKRDEIRGLAVSNNNDLYVCGVTESLTGISTPNAQQPNFIPGNNTVEIVPRQNMFLAKFKEVPLSNSSFTKNNISLFPNPNQGSFTITGLEDKNTLSIFDTSGRKIVEKTTSQNSFSMETNLSKGIYFVEVISNNNEKQVVKMIME